MDKSVASQTTYTWHHKCDNTTGFVSQSSWNVDFESDWTITSGSLISCGTYFYFADILPAALWHGPVYVYELPERYPLANLTRLSIQYDVDNSNGGDAGAIWVCLADSSGDPIITSRVVDDEGSISKGTVGVEYRTSVNTPYFCGGLSVPFTSYQSTMEVWYNETYGVMANVEGYGATSLYDPTPFEEAREIRYVVLMGGEFTSSPWIFARVLDIMIQFETGSTTTSTTTSTTITPTTTTTTPTTTTQGVLSSPVFGVVLAVVLSIAAAAGGGYAFLRKRPSKVAEQQIPVGAKVLVICPFYGAKTEQGVTHCQHCKAPL